MKKKPNVLCACISNYSGAGQVASIVVVGSKAVSGQNCHIDSLHRWYRVDKGESRMRSDGFITPFSSLKESAPLTVAHFCLFYVRVGSKVKYGQQKLISEVVICLLLWDQAHPDHHNHHNRHEQTMVLA